MPRKYLIWSVTVSFYYSLVLGRGDAPLWVHYNRRMLFVSVQVVGAGFVLDYEDLSVVHQV